MLLTLQTVCTTCSSLLPPSARLPPVHQISDQPIDALINLFLKISVCSCAVARFQPPQVVETNPGDTSCVEAEEQFRTDEVERAHAVFWLTGLVARSSMFDGPLADDKPRAELDHLIRSASALIGTSRVGSH
ncbi:hypothetical protein C8Q80DRAFT_1206693 [Daedaleopsis nitida]|nr:hypothetical protein C8Q80DRAFT_1206693 [Daedaleopsis nitida]